jgi:hypothetical protein
MKNAKELMLEFTAFLIRCVTGRRSNQLNYAPAN